jgi:hypothetical protein
MFLNPVMICILFYQDTLLGAITDAVRSGGPHPNKWYNRVAIRMLDGSSRYLIVTSTYKYWDSDGIVMRFDDGCGSTNGGLWEMVCVGAGL